MCFPKKANTNVHDASFFQSSINSRLNAIMLHLSRFLSFFAFENSMAPKLTSGRSKWRTAVFGPFLLLMLYLAGASQVGFLYAFGHDHAVTISHSYEEEKDPCHRLIYHNDAEAGCGHDVHVTVSDKCYLCDFAIHTDKTLLMPSAHLPLTFDQNSISFYKTDLDSYWAVLSSSRAPPAIS